jgi:hypothetical protein
MLLIDDILLFPARGVGWIVNQVRQAAEHEFENEADAIRNELREMYMMLETGKLSDAEFEAREAPLLARLEALESRDTDAGHDGETDDN